MDATANCAEPAKVVADMTIGAAQPMPAARASTPNDRANANAAIPIGAIALAPST
jgi:hypothetical protein